MYCRPIQSGPRTEASRAERVPPLCYATTYKSTTLRIPIQHPSLFLFCELSTLHLYNRKPFIFIFLITFVLSEFLIVKLLWCYLGIEIDAYRGRSKFLGSREKMPYFSVSNKRLSQGFKPTLTHFPTCLHFIYEYIFKHTHSTFAASLRMCPFLNLPSFGHFFSTHVRRDNSDINMNFKIFHQAANEQVNSSCRQDYQQETNNIYKR